MLICGLASLVLGISYFIINCGEDDFEDETNEKHEWDDNKVHTEGGIMVTLHVWQFVVILFAVASLANIAGLLMACILIAGASVDPSCHPTRR